MIVETQSKNMIVPPLQALDTDIKIKSSFSHTGTNPTLKRFVRRLLLRSTGYKVEQRPSRKNQRPSQHKHVTRSPEKRPRCSERVYGDYM